MLTLNDIYGGIIAAGVLVNIWAVISSKRASVKAAGRAEAAAHNASDQAIAVAQAVAVVATKIEDVHATTNGVRVQLEESAFARGKLEGQADKV